MPQTIEKPKSRTLLEKKISILQAISETIVATSNTDAIANILLDLSVTYTNAEKGSLMVVDDRDELTMLAARGIAGHVVRNYRAKVGEGIAGTVARRREPCLVTDIEKDPRFRGRRRDRYRTTSFISCPIISRKKLIGVLNVNDKKDGTAFTEDEFSLIRIIANQAAITLENAMLMNELSLRAIEFEEVNRKLIEADVIKTEFLTRVSHELRTPLNAIKGAIYYLQKSDKGARNGKKSFYDIISLETDGLISTVEHLLDFLRTEDETRIMRRSILNPLSVLQKAAEISFLRAELMKRNIVVDIETSGDVPDIAADKVRIVQFFINLIEGLSRSLSDGDAIKIGLRADRDLTMTFSLPKGFPETVLSAVRSPGQLFHEEQPDGRLKIFLARRIAEAHDWKMSAGSNDGFPHLSVTIPSISGEKRSVFLRSALDLFTQIASEMLDLKTCSIMLVDEMSGDLTIRSAVGIDELIMQKTRLRPGESVAGWVAIEGKALLIEDIEKHPQFGRRNLPRYNTKSLLSVPLKRGEKVLGVLNMNNKRTSEPFTDRDLAIATVLSERMTHFINKVLSGKDRDEDLRKAVDTLDHFLTAERKYSKRDCRFPDLTAAIMDRLGVSGKEKTLAVYMSAIYDIGVTLIDESVLEKDVLSGPELQAIRSHPFNTLSLLKSFETSEEVMHVILHHHERFDGTGYPDGLKGEEIPLLSRVLSVVDCYCALTKVRLFSPIDAVGEIRRGAGSVYDPAVVRALGESILQEPCPNEVTA